MTAVRDQAIEFRGTLAPPQGLRIPRHRRYDVGEGDFTLEVWFRAEEAGALVSRQSQNDRPEPGEGRFGLWVDEEGVSINIEVGDSGRRHAHRVAASLLDGRWHHVACVREARELLLYVDGELRDGETHNDFGAGRTGAIDTRLPLLVGHDRYLPTREQSMQVTQVRFWETARSDHTLLSLLYHRLTGAEEGLIGLWNLDDGKGTDSSPLKNHGEPRNGARAVTTDIALIVPGRPYIYSRCQLMQDYRPSGGDLMEAEELSSFRVSLAPRTADGEPHRDCKLELWAEEEVSVFVNGRSRRLGPGARTEARPNINGEVSVVIPAGEEVHAPVLYLHADFMEPGHTVSIAADAHAHATLGHVTAKQLLGEHDPESRLPGLTRGKEPLLSGAARRHAEPLAQALGNLSRGAAEHETFPILTLFQAAEEARHPEKALWRAPVARLPHGFHFANDLSRQHGLAGLRGGLRIFAAEHMEHPHWEYDFEGASFAPRSAEEVEPIFASAEVVHGDELSRYLASLGPAGAARVAVSADQLQGDFGRLSQNPSLIPFSLWDLFKDAAKAVVRTVTYVVEEIKKEVRVVQIALQRAGKWFCHILHTVEKVGEAIGCFFRKVGVAVAKVVEFVRTLFHWEDIVLVHDGLYNYVKQSFLQATSQIDALKQRAHGFFADREGEIREKLEEGIDKLEGRRIGSAGSSRHAAGGGIQSRWMANTFADHVEEARFKVPDAGGVDTDRLFSTLDGHYRPHEERLKALACERAGEPDPWKWLLADLLRRLEELLTLGLDLLDKTVAAVLELVKRITDFLFKLLDARIQIPVITWLYEKKIVPGGCLSALDLMALTAAVPATVLYKLAKGGGFDAEDRKALGRLKGIKAGEMHWLEIPVPGRRETPLEPAPLDERLFNTITWFIGGAELGASSIAMICQLKDDATLAREGRPGGAAPSPAKVIGAASSLVSWVLSLPLNYKVFTGRSRARDILSYVFELRAWLPGGLVWLLGTIVDIFVDPAEKEASALGQRLLAILAAVHATALFLFFIPVNILEGAELAKWLQNYIGLVPSFAQLFVLSEETKELAPVVTAIGFGAYFILAFARWWTDLRTGKAYIII